MLALRESLAYITGDNTPAEVRLVAMRDFAEALNWTPSYELNAPVPEARVYDHLVVHHGLSNSAVISFVRGGSRATDLSDHNLRNLLQVSYNNMIDWHFFVSENDAFLVNNREFESRQRNFDDAVFPGAPGYSHFLSSKNLDRRSSNRRRGISDPCDDVLLNIVDKWKRLLRDESENVRNQNISTLFNAMFLIRGCEDRHLSLGLDTGKRVLLAALENMNSDFDFQDFVRSAFTETDVSGNLEKFLNFHDLEVFSNLDRSTTRRLILDLYEPREAPFRLNFALMSKHALSRIYEKFVAILVEDETPTDQVSFLKRPLIEKSQKHFGAVYTPQFIASFFARYLRENTTPRKFREMTVLDPACGSGIFLRTVIEEQCNLSDRAITKGAISEIFDNVTGVDRDGNALEATRLSLALLHLVTTDRLPENLNLIQDDVFEAEGSGRLTGEYDAILTNPPYIKLDNLSEDQRAGIVNYLGKDFSGRADAYLAFMQLCLGKISEGGFCFFVIPQTFLRAKNANFIRRLISEQFDIRCLVDLSSVRVFEGVGAYSILLIVQKRREATHLGRSATIGQVTDYVGSALQAVLEEADTREPYFKIFSVEQSDFQSKEWIIKPPEINEISLFLSRFPTLSDYLNCYQGFVTGADSVFIRDVLEIAEGESEIYLPYLPDREIGQYEVPPASRKVVLYPYGGNGLLDEEEIKNGYPETWKYLEGHKEILSRRKRSDGTPWWRPYRPRSPERMLRPKIVAPHLMLTPRFAVDREGRFATKHGPFMVTKIAGGDEGLLLDFFSAVLNSAVSGWYIRNHMPTFGRGYSRLEVATLRDLPVPNLEELQTREIEALAHFNRVAVEDKRARGEIDRIVASMFGLEIEELRIMGIGAE